MAKTVVDVVSLEAGEVRTRQHDWTDNLPSPTAVLSVTATGKDLTTGIDATSDVIYSTLTASGITTLSLQKLAAKGSTAYDIKLTMNRSDNMIFIDHYLVPADMDRTVYSLIDRSLRLLGVRNIGQPLSAEEQDQGLEALNTLLLSWSSERMLVQALQTDSFSAVPGQSTYTLGQSVTADVNTIRPEKFISGMLFDSNMVNAPLTQIGVEGVTAIVNPLQSGKPNVFAYDNEYPLGSVYLFPTPDAAYQVALFSIKEMANYSSVAVNHGLEGDYENAVSYNLAVHLAPKYGVVTAPEVVAVAAQSISRLINERYGKLDATLDAGIMVV